MRAPGCTLPKVVVPVDLAGSSCDMAAIGALAERYGFALLEVASHAIGGRYQGEPVGNCRHSAIEVFSFHPVEIISTGEGGQDTTIDPLLAQRMAELRNHGIVREAVAMSGQRRSPGCMSSSSWAELRITDIQVALGLSQLQRLDEVVVE
jgi:dTDP-4-amino-4,6-dideoxygalactose transaminase